MKPQSGGLGYLNATTVRRAFQIDLDHRLGLDGKQFENGAGKYRGPLQHGLTAARFRITLPAFQRVTCHFFAPRPAKGGFRPDNLPGPKREKRHRRPFGVSARARRVSLISKVKPRSGGLGHSNATTARRAIQIDFGHQLGLGGE